MVRCGDTLLELAAANDGRGGICGGLWWILTYLALYLERWESRPTCLSYRLRLGVVSEIAIEDG